MFSQFDQRIAALEEQVSKLQEQNKALEKENAELKEKSSHNIYKVPLCIFNNTIVYLNKNCTQTEFNSNVLALVHSLTSTPTATQIPARRNIKIRFDIESLCDLQNVHEFNIQNFAFFSNTNLLFYNNGDFICSAPTIDNVYERAMGENGPYDKLSGISISLTKINLEKLVQAFAEIKINLLLNGMHVDLINNIQFK